MRALAHLALLLAAGCSSSAGESEASAPLASERSTGSPEEVDDEPVPVPVPVHGYEIVHTHPHDRGAYTQGLLFHDGFLYESTGRYDESSLRQWVPETGRLILKHDLEPTLFAEGLARYKGVLIQLTWKNGVAVVYDARSFAELDRHEYEGEGWGLTFDGESLVMSTGGSKLQLRDPKTFELRRELEVTYLDPRTGAPSPLYEINELEWIEGEIWANVYQEELIARIDPKTGAVRSWVDLTGLQAKQGVRDQRQDVLNGIAYDPEGKRIFVTGKYWPNLYEIRVLE